MSSRTRARARPERTCVGCRARAAKDDLLRTTLVGDECVPDPRGTLPGRGAYVHPDEACLDLAVRRRSLPRALRARGPLTIGRLREWVERHQAPPQSEAPPPRANGAEEQQEVTR
ncbi:YlxR family protein [Wenjunlia vitaminophila]|uniref:YlxR family protein n=1 Tax=Wenjunlia vitaminophila TaxID=76728 RepID=UPI000998B14B|nr:YlxR family protein [Wenjunlia vitaminophila]